MFSSTRIRLTALNATVFFIILTCIGIIVYVQLRHHLYAKVDESLRLKVTQNDQVFYNLTEVPEMKELPQGAIKKENKMLVQVQGIDPRVFLILWDNEGNASPMLSGEYSKKAAEAFKANRDATEPVSVEVDGHHYRIYSMTYEQPVRLNLRLLDKKQVESNGLPLKLPLLSDPSTAVSAIVSVQAISIVDSEQNMLRQLMILILSGIVGGGALTVLAGLYLANKALQPIKLSWDKQQQFVADASHELRMPLTIIRANAELAFRHPDRSILEMSEPLSMVLAESIRMGKLTDQLLTLARADSNQEELVLKPLLLDEPIAEVYINLSR